MIILSGIVQISIEQLKLVKNVQCILKVSGKSPHQKKKSISSIT